jgi:hypothetical protein
MRKEIYVEKMRAKVRVTGVEDQNYGVNGTKSAEKLTFTGVPAGKYPDDGSDENNTFAKFSPQVDMSFTVANPALWGGFKAGEEYYADFTPATT